MRRAHYAWLPLVALSCATAETTTPLGGELGEFGGSGAEPGSAGSGGGGGSGVPGTSGMATVGGGGAASAGTFGFSGATSFGGGGTFGNFAGSDGEGAGSSSGGAGAGGTASGGAGGSTGKAGAGGSSGSGGGGGTAKCGDHAIAARTQWKATASSECAPTCADPNGPFTADLAIDANTATRWATGKTQTGGEWLQIDLGSTASVNRLSINTASATDYTRHYQVRVSASSNDMAAAVLAEADGAAGTINITLNKTIDGRYVLITQTGSVVPDTFWWSVNDITIACQ